MSGLGSLTNLGIGDAVDSLQESVVHGLLQEADVVLAILLDPSGRPVLVAHLLIWKQGVVVGGVVLVFVTDLVVLCHAGEHDDGATVPLVHHLPEVPAGLLKRTLCNNELPLQLVPLQKSNTSMGHVTVM